MRLRETGSVGITLAMASKQTILVTGAAGFIGSHVVDELVARGHEVVAMDDLSGGFRDNVNPKAQFVEGSVVNAALIGKLFEQYRFEYVILDANEQQFPPPITQEFFDSFHKNPNYRLIFAETNVFVFQRLGGESDWKIPPSEVHSAEE